MYTITTFWSADNIIAKKRLQEQLEQRIQSDWKSSRYRRLAYYFFEKEIQSDITKELESQAVVSNNLLIDPEYQACISRSAVGVSTGLGIVWDEMTLDLNNYLFGQGEY